MCLKLRNVSGFGVTTLLPKTNYMFKVEDMNGFGVTTSLPKSNYMFKVEECEWIWCNHRVTPIELYLKS